MTGIYKITNPKGKIYIGQSVNIKARVNQYKCLSKYSLGRKIYNSINKYGWENHKFEIIEECGTPQLNEKEVYWGEKYNTLNEGLNLALGGNNLKRYSTETKEKMSNSAKKIMTPSHRKKLSEAKLGKKLTEEQKQKLRVPKKSKINYQNNVGKWRKRPVKPIAQYSLDNELIKEWDSIFEAYTTLGIKSGGSIICCLKGKQKTAHGFKWEYISRL
jgi:group I intron endonuclease